MSDTCAAGNNVCVEIESYPLPRCYLHGRQLRFPHHTDNAGTPCGENCKPATQAAVDQIINDNPRFVSGPKREKEESLLQPSPLPYVETTSTNGTNPEELGEDWGMIRLALANAEPLDFVSVELARKMADKIRSLQGRVGVLVKAVKEALSHLPEEASGLSRPPKAQILVEILEESLSNLPEAERNAWDMWREDVEEKIELRAENTRLREALERIMEMAASHTPSNPFAYAIYDECYKVIPQAALNPKEKS